MVVNRVVKGASIVVLLSGIIAGCNFKPGNKVLATVDNEVITEQYFQAKIDRLPPYYRSLAGDQKDKFLDEIINEKLFLKEAYRRGIDRNKEVRELLEEARKKIIIAKFIEEKVSKNTDVNDKEVEDFYNIHKNEFIVPVKYRASHILTATEQEAKDVLSKLNKGADFAGLAKEFSVDPSKTNGGDLGFFTEGQMIPDFEAACFKLEIGQASNIVRTQFGYHIIRLTDKKPAQARALNEVSDQIKRRLLDTKKIEKLQDIIKELRASARIKKGNNQ